MINSEIDNSNKIILTREEWNNIIRYRTPIKTIVRNTGWLSNMLNKKTETLTLGGHKHPIIQGIYWYNGKQMFMGKEIIIGK